MNREPKEAMNSHRPSGKTLSGRFLAPEPIEAVHECEKPTNPSSYALGTRWQCNCGVIYRVQELKAYGSRMCHWVKRPVVEQEDGHHTGQTHAQVRVEPKTMRPGAIPVAPRRS